MVIEVSGNRSSSEDRAVLRLCSLIIFASLSVIALRRVPAAQSAADLSPYQSLFRDLPSAEQRVFREMQEGLLEAEMVRGREKIWPTPQALGDQGIPPFAAEPGLARTWTFLQDQRDIEYLGTADGLSVLALSQEPDPRYGGDPANTPADETHHKLSDGAILHVSIWLHPGAVAGDQLIRHPYASGWRQVVIDPRASVGITP